MEEEEATFFPGISATWEFRLKNQRGDITQFISHFQIEYIFFTYYKIYAKSTFLLYNFFL